MPKMVFVDANGARKEVDAPLGASVLEIAHQNNIDIEGTCEGQMACSTCHLIIEADWFGKLEPPGEEENDMLDFAHGLTRTSRLACQIRIVETLDGLTVNLPAETRNMLLG